MNSVNYIVLTPQEKYILKLISYEFSSNEIATELGLSLQEISNIRESIIMKLNSTSNIGLFKSAVKLGLVEGFYFGIDMNPSLN